MLLAILALVVLASPAPGAPPAERLIRLDAGSFAYSPSVVHVNPGDRVTLELRSTDVVHGVHVDGYDLGVTAEPGQPARLTFTADRVGVFRLRCSVTCGPLHPFMLGKLQVGTDGRPWRWLGAAGLVAAAAFLFSRDDPTT